MNKIIVFVVLYFFSVTLLVGQDEYHNNTEEMDISVAILGKWENTSSILLNYYFIFEFFENGHGIQTIKNLTNDELSIESIYTFAYSIKGNIIEFYFDQNARPVEFILLNNILTLKGMLYARNNDILHHNLVFVKIE
jgi:hypothetical protein